MTNRRAIISAGLVASVLSIALLASATNAFAGGLSSARAVAMGGAHIGLAQGVDAARYNPANLGFARFQQTGVELASVGTSIKNNSFTLGDYNTYNGAYLSTADKSDILGKIPTEGLKLSADADASALSFSYGQFVFAMSGSGSAAVNLNKDIIDLILNGNSVADTLTVTGSYSDAVAYGSAGISYGRPLFNLANRPVSVGATFKYLYGFGIERVVELEGTATTNLVGYTGQGRMIAQTASGGRGFAMDVGAAIQINQDYTAGIAVSNLLSTISWTEDPEEHGYLFSFDSMTIDNSDIDSIVVSEEYSEPISSFSSTLPSEMTIGFAKNSGKFIWAIDYVQGFRKESAGASTKPRMCGGIEWSALSTFPLRLGFSTGGNRSTAFSVGTGIHAPVFYLDVAAVVGSSFSGESSKGTSLSVSTGLLL